MENYKELYEHSKNVFNEELQRFSRIDLKASQFFTVITLLIGATGYFWKWLLDNTIPPKCLIDWTLFFLGILLSLFVLISWYFNFKVLRLQDLLKSPLNDETIIFFSKNRLIDIYYHMSEEYKNSLVHNRKITDNKSKYLSYGYKSIIISVSFLIIFSVFLTIKIWNNNSNNNAQNTRKDIVKMNDDIQNTQNTNNDSNDQSKPISDNEPNPNVKPPQFQLVTESFDPKKVKTRENIKKEIVNGIKPNNSETE